MKRFDLVFSPIQNEKPKLIISMRQFNHVYLGLYKGFNENANKEDVNFFWAEHNNKDTFHRCLVSSDRLKCWNFDALENGISESYDLTALHKKILTDLNNDIYFLNHEGFLKPQYNILLKRDNNYTFVLREEDSDQEEWSLAEVEILSVLNNSWSLDTSLNFKITG